jgi:hypothetical protein
VSDLFKRAKGLFGRGEPEPKPLPAKKPIQSWHAVAIAPGPRACTAARELVDRRFLSRDAPPLPLKKCDSPECACRYEHYKDRRSGPRRAREMGVAVDAYEYADRRAKQPRGRRKTDT